MGDLERTIVGGAAAAAADLLESFADIGTAAWGAAARPTGVAEANDGRWFLDQAAGIGDTAATAAAGVKSGGGWSLRTAVRIPGVATGDRPLWWACAAFFVVGTAFTLLQLAVPVVARIAAYGPLRRPLAPEAANRHCPPAAVGGIRKQIGFLIFYIVALAVTVDCLSNSSAGGGAVAMAGGDVDYSGPGWGPPLRLAGGLEASVALLPAAVLFLAHVARRLFETAVVLRASGGMGLLGMLCGAAFYAFAPPAVFLARCDGRGDMGVAFAASIAILQAAQAYHHWLLRRMKTRPPPPMVLRHAGASAAQAAAAAGGASCTSTTALDGSRRLSTSSCAGGLVNLAPAGKPSAVSPRATANAGQQAMGAKRLAPSVDHLNESLRQDAIAESLEASMSYGNSMSMSMSPRGATQSVVRLSAPSDRLRATRQPPRGGLFRHFLAPHYAAEVLMYVLLAVWGAVHGAGPAAATPLALCAVFSATNLALSVRATRRWYEAQRIPAMVLPRWNMVPYVW